jgi:hypothetical protein
MQTFAYEYTDTFAGEANYCWVKRGKVTVPDLTHYGYDGSHGYARANRSQAREIVRKVKAAINMTGIRARRSDYGDMIRLDFVTTCVFISWDEESNA